MRCPSSRTDGSTASASTPHSRRCELSDREPEEIDVQEDPADAESTPGLWWRALLAAAVSGAVVGLIDVLLSLRSANDVVSGGDALHVVGFYAAFFAPFGLVALVLSRCFDWRSRALALLIGYGAALFFVAAWANIYLLPDFLSAWSLLADLVLVLATLWLFRRSYQGTGYDEIRTGRWAGLGLVTVVVAFALGLLPGRDAGPAPTLAVAQGAARPNVLVFMVDTLRADHLSCYGYDRETSPEVDAFAADAVLFEDCQAPSSWTKPSVGAIFTGLPPTSHGAVGPRNVLAPAAETLPELLQKAGWRTGAMSDNPFITRDFGFGQGFDVFHQLEPDVITNGTLLGKVLFMLRVRSLVGDWFAVGDTIHEGAFPRVDQALAFIDEAADDPWFCYVHLMEPHLPYDPPREYAEAFGFPAGEPYERPPVYNGILPHQKAPEPPPGLREKLVAQYDGEIRDMSAAFGKLLDGLRERGLYEDTLVVFVADHGEEFHEHGGWTHGHSLHAETIHVPLIVRVPQAIAPEREVGRGRRVRGIVSSTDLFRTLIGALELEYPRLADERDFVDGRSLMACLVGKEGKRPLDALSDGDRPIFSEVTMGSAELRAVRHGQWKLIVSRTGPLDEVVQLFAPRRDPGETEDHADRKPDLVAELRDKLDSWFRVFEGARLTREERELDDETRERLMQLGYTGGD